MVRITKKLFRVIFVCLLIVSLCMGIGIWFVYQKNNVRDQKKFVSWASIVPIESTQLYPVTDVVDGDTIKTTIEGHNITIRLLGINTPEVIDPRKPVECYGPEASAETKSLLTGKSVSLVLNLNYERIDKYGRLLAYVHVGSLFINEYLVKEGYAREYTFNNRNPYQYQSLFKADELEAKQAKKGLWGKCSTN